MLMRPDVHTQRLLALADFLENLEPERFSMRQWGQLGEPRCVCGWFLHEEGDVINLDNWHEAADRLGLDHSVAGFLFSPENDWDNKQAARAVRDLAV
jgi:hypothetical protein